MPKLKHKAGLRQKTPRPPGDLIRADVPVLSHGPLASLLRPFLAARRIVGQFLRRFGIILWKEMQEEEVYGWPAHLFLYACVSVFSLALYHLHEPGEMVLYIFPALWLLDRYQTRRIFFTNPERAPLRLRREADGRLVHIIREGKRLRTTRFLQEEVDEFLLERVFHRAGAFETLLRGGWELHLIRSNGRPLICGEWEELSEAIAAGRRLAAELDTPLHFAGCEDERLFHTDPYWKLRTPLLKQGRLSRAAEFRLERTEQSTRLDIRWHPRGSRALVLEVFQEAGWLILLLFSFALMLRWGMILDLIFGPWDPANPLLAASGHPFRSFFTFHLDWLDLLEILVSLSIMGMEGRRFFRDRSIELDAKSLRYFENGELAACLETPSIFDPVFFRGRKNSVVLTDNNGSLEIGDFLTDEEYRALTLVLHTELNRFRSPTADADIRRPCPSGRALDEKKEA
ncbi:MAG: hypothetical protein CSB33_04390 [Desulfobacterales bacterium]|nr:MAG: hypothetical protein CSB33_04390 [Desulfobacterales bacterium]